jgi:hypothetical protein
MGRLLCSVLVSLTFWLSVVVVVGVIQTLAVVERVDTSMYLGPIYP